MQNLNTYLQNYVEKIFDTSNYEAEKPLTISKNRKVIRMIKDEEIVALRPKIYSYLTDEREGHKNVSDQTRNKMSRLKKNSKE